MQLTHSSDLFSSSPNSSQDDASPSSYSTEQPTESKTTDTWEQESLLKEEEPEWHKSVRKNHDATKESVWIDQMVLDPRIAERMRKFVLDREPGRPVLESELS
jgi:import inner membrane translocase subunit TIM54